MCTIIENRTFRAGYVYKYNREKFLIEKCIYDQTKKVVDNQYEFNECTFYNMTFKDIDFSETKIINSKFIRCVFVYCTNPIALKTNTLIHCRVTEKDSEKSQEWNCVIPMICPEEGEFIAYKKLRKNRIATLRIPADAKRSSAYGRKCRADKAEVIKIESLTKPEMKCRTGYGLYQEKFKYKVGECVYPKNGFDENRFNECAPGIHFFMTIHEAINYGE